MLSLVLLLATGANPDVQNQALGHCAATILTSVDHVSLYEPKSDETYERLQVMKAQLDTALSQYGENLDKLSPDDLKEVNTQAHLFIDVWERAKQLNTARAVHDVMLKQGQDKCQSMGIDVPRFKD